MLKASKLVYRNKAAQSTLSQNCTLQNGFTKKCLIIMIQNDKINTFVHVAFFMIPDTSWNST